MKTQNKIKNFFKQANKNESGYTLIECLMAIVVLTVGFSAFMTLQGNVVSKSSAAEQKSIALNLVQEKLEELKTQGLSTALENSDSGSDILEGYERTWTISNGGEGNLTSINVMAKWNGPAGDDSVSLNTVVSQ